MLTPVPLQRNGVRIRQLYDLERPNFEMSFSYASPLSIHVQFDRNSVSL